MTLTTSSKQDIGVESDRSVQAIKAVLPIMLQKWGRINIASINGKLPAIHGAAYGSKHGLLGLTRNAGAQ